MQLVRLVGPPKRHAQAEGLIRLVEAQFPEMLVHSQALTGLVEPTLVLLTGRLSPEAMASVSPDPARRLVLRLAGVESNPPAEWEIVPWPGQEARVLERLAEWVGPSTASASQAPAHTLWVELSTRITTRRLHFRSGDEEAAAHSIFTLFGKARELMEAYREAAEFNRLALPLLNELLRPYTARWHGWMTQVAEQPDAEGKPLARFRDERLRQKFREELRDLQPRVLGFQKALAAVAAGRAAEPALLAPGKELLEVLMAECERSLPPADLGERVQPALRAEVKLRLAGPDGRTEERFDPLVAELKAIQRRRRALTGATPEAEVEDVAGLALSGGGIRSATFCLGIVQGLQARGLFQQFDYLSTVSGGGYLGAFLSCYLGWEPEALDRTESEVQARRSTGLDLTATAGAAPVARAGTPPLERLKEAFARPKQSETDATGVDGSAESLALRHLRNNSRYLLNGGAWGLWRILGVVLTGFGTSFIILLTLPLLGAWALLGLQHVDVTTAWEEAGANPPWLWLGLATVVMAGSVCALLSSNRRGESDDIPVSEKGRLLGALLLVGGWSLVMAAYLGTWIYPQWKIAEDPIWPEALGIGFVGSFGVWALFWLCIPLTQRIAQGVPWNSGATRVRDLIEAAGLIASLLALLLGAIFVAPWVVFEYETLRDHLGEWLGRVAHVKLPEYVTAVLTGVATFVLGGVAKNKGKGNFSLMGVLLVLFTPAFFLISFLVFSSHLGIAGKGDWSLRWAGGITVAVLAWVWCFLNVNTFAPHRYYRNRLCECYLAVRGRSQRSWGQRVLDACFHGGDLTARNPEESVGTLERLPLSALGANAAAPYHLINATLNAAASKHPTLRGRDGDFFLFSRHYCGSPLTGYVTTENLERADPHVDLGTAMAISGAAASTNMGDMAAMKRYRFLITLFNVRLGYWMRRPGLTARRRPFDGPGAAYFFREMVGAVHERSPYVNVSDGGHIENLAAYELLRRQCKYIVCVDAAMEPGMQCAELMRLQRYAAIDFGIDMQFDPADFTILPTSYSRAYAILVKIDYAPGGEGEEKRGWMLYLKLAMTGTEPRYVLEYRRENPTFPHQTTANQIYDEAQFEAYRALGECALNSVFREEILGRQTPAGIREWFQSVANSFLPDNDAAFAPPPRAASDATA